jgi:flagellar biosynthesis/type III secretory pathway protein FliH
MRKSVDDMTDLEKWALFLHYANIPEYREAINKVIQSKEALQMAGSLLMSVSKDERERAVNRSRRMYQTDMQSDIATAEDRGRQEGIQIGEQIGLQIGEQRGLQIGRQEGVQTGRREGAFAMARNMIADGEPVEKITNYTGLTRGEVEDLDV